ncbi:AAA family ATPase [Pseudonocardia abyssalis]|uniref:AAA family ATPase n=1 Tax=Pseudonocardia abyssalis TaxID=2792008 RepID=A0ABS6UXF3_9PSEU|nr:AAA family ATPase [Pseudonocardia abyssalis]MBW0115405.1 AAA family ATPase [Pseudonocardia abyssalis]MBW0136847.1 AAA family ATPase [Pseudonocardia abyssalis]
MKPKTRTIDVASVSESALAKLEAQLLSSADLDDLPPRIPLIKNWLYKDSLARIHGHSGHYKTFVILDMACHVALGRTWRGNRVDQGLVLYIVAEGISGFQQRVRAWEQEFNNGARIPKSQLMILPKPVQVGDPNEWAPFIALVAKYRPALIVLDTQARVSVGREENSNTDMGVFVDYLEQMRTESGCCGVLIHHRAKAGNDGRGAVGVKGALTTELAVERGDGESTKMNVTIRADKQKDGEEREIKTSVRVVDLVDSTGAPRLDEDGDKVTSLVLAEISLYGPNKTVIEPLPSISKADIVLAVLRDSGGVKTMTVGHSLVKTHCDSIGYRGLASPSSFNPVWHELIDSERIWKDKDIAGDTRYRAHDDRPADRLYN